MERVSLIIKKLQDLVDDNASADILLAIAQMLVTELQQLPQPEGARGVSVTIPKRSFIVEETTQQEELIVKAEDTPMAVPVHLPIADEVEPIQQQELFIDNEEKVEEPVAQAYSWNVRPEEITPIENPREEYVLAVPDEVIEEVQEEEPVSKSEFQQPLEATTNAFFFEGNTGIPTLPQVEKPKYELNEALAKEENDINNSFKENKVEVAHLHENTQIKDLKRAISINEKYLFINELFHGDEELYDKCIKHIQQFSIHPEATYWIQKELKTKLEWPADDEVVQLFDQLVKRRFA